MSYYCECIKYCKGRRKEVSRATYYSHQKRDPLWQFSPEFQASLRAKQVVAGLPIGPSSSTFQGRRARTSGVPDGHETGLGAKRMRLDGDEGTSVAVAVGAMV